MANKYRSRNLGLLARRFQPLRQKAVFALEFGLDMLVAGMKIRAPHRTGHLVKMIRKTKIKNDHARHRLYGRAVSLASYSKYVEYGTKRSRARPFVRPTSRIDGPLAVQAMEALLRSET